MELGDHVVIVTGASRGLGLAIARRCAREGARVVCAARTAADLDAAVGSIAAEGGRAIAVAADVSRMADLERIVARALDAYGAIHGLVNNAGVDFVKPFTEVTEAEWDRVMAVDLKGAFFLTQLCARQMSRQSPPGGSIVQIASVHTHASVAGAAPYDAAKHGMVGFSKAAAVELAPHNIRVNLLSPGLCRTEIWEDLAAAAPEESECVAYWNSNIPAGRLIEPDEIAAACVFLLGAASSCITGANLMADLGMTSLLVSRAAYRSRPIVGQ